MYVPRYTFDRALENQKHINQLRMGETFVEVERTMGRGPERRNARVRFDGVAVEEWSYVSDPVRKLDTVLTFVGGKLVEINTAPWPAAEEEERGSEQR